MKKLYYLLLLISSAAQAQPITTNSSTSENKYLASIYELEKVSDDNTAEVLLNTFGSDFKEVINKQDADAKLLSENMRSIVDAFTRRLEKSQSNAEVDKLFDLINALVQKKEYDVNMDRYIAYQVSEALKAQYEEARVYLGDLLFEGYKAYLQENEIPKKASGEDVKQVYKYVIAASDEISLERNILLAQVRLLAKDDLICNQKETGKISENTPESKLNKITFSMLNRSADDLIQQSAILDTALILPSEYYQKRDRSIRIFNYKLDKFAQLHRISRGEKDLIFDEPLLLFNEKRYDGCPLIYHVNRKDFTTFPN